MASYRRKNRRGAPSDEQTSRWRIRGGASSNARDSRGGIFRYFYRRTFQRKECARTFYRLRDRPSPAIDRPAIGAILRHHRLQVCWLWLFGVAAARTRWHCKIAFHFGSIYCGSPWTETSSLHRHFDDARGLIALAISFSQRYCTLVPLDQCATDDVALPSSYGTLAIISHGLRKWLPDRFWPYRMAADFGTFHCAPEVAH